MHYRHKGAVKCTFFQSHLLHKMCVSLTSVLLTNYWYVNSSNIGVFLTSTFSLWHCWLGVRKSIRPIKNWVMGYWRGYLSGVWCKWFAYGPADATATPSSLASVKSSTFLVLAYPGCPGKKVIKHMCVLTHATWAHSCMHSIAVCWNQWVIMMLTVLCINHGRNSANKKSQERQILIYKPPI